MGAVLLERRFELDQKVFGHLGRVTAAAKPGQ
jgi:hypothetical protein